MAARHRRTEWVKALHLTCWKRDGVCSRKLELEHFLTQHGVDICLLSETFFNPGQAFRLASYVCHLRQTDCGGGTAILVHHGIVHHSVPIPGLTHLEATAIQVILAGKLVKILVAYLSPSHPLIGVDLNDSFGGGFLVLMAGDLNANHVDWKSHLNTRWMKPLRDYADKNSCLIFELTNPYNPSTTHDILDIVITKNLSSSVYLTSCSALSLDHLPVLIYTVCCSPFQHPPDHSDFMHTDWANFQTHLEDQIPFNPKLHSKMAIDTCIENFFNTVLMALAASTPK